MPRIGTASGIFAALILSGCAADQAALESTALKDNIIPGRWMLAAPNSPPCGLEFGGTPGATGGKVAPDGGCPANLYLSRHWLLAGSDLTITDDANRVLAQLKSAGAGFEGQSATGIPITLSH